VPGALSLDVKQLGHETDHSYNLMLRFVNGAVPPLLNMHSWCVRVQLLLHSVAFSLELQLGIFSVNFCQLPVGRHFGILQALAHMQFQHNLKQYTSLCLRHLITSQKHYCFTVWGSLLGALGSVNVKTIQLL
jgi:hypothetical protein